MQAHRVVGRGAWGEGGEEEGWGALLRVCTREGRLKEVTKDSKK